MPTTSDVQSAGAACRPAFARSAVKVLAFIGQSSTKSDWPPRQCQQEPAYCKGNQLEGALQEHQRDSPGHQEDAVEPRQGLPQKRYRQEGDNPLQKVYGWCGPTCAG